jgi:hypothetical protein
MLRPFLICTFLAAIALPFTARPPSAWADTTEAGAGSGANASSTSPSPAPEVATAGSGSAAPAPATAPKASDAIHNPATDPSAAWDDARAAKKTSWPLAVWAVLAMLGKALAYGATALAGVPLLGRLAAMLAKGKAAMVIAGIGAVGAAGFDVLVNGGTLTAALVASSVAIAGVTHSTTQPKKEPAG